MVMVVGVVVMMVAVVIKYGVVINIVMVVVRIVMALKYEWHFVVIKYVIMVMMMGVSVVMMKCRQYSQIRV